MRDSMQIGELSSERSALKWQRGCDGKCHRDSPVTEKLIEEVSTMSIIYKAIPVNETSDISGDRTERPHMRQLKWYRGRYQLSSLIKCDKHFLRRGLFYFTGNNSFP